MGGNRGNRDRWGVERELGLGRGDPMGACFGERFGGGIFTHAPSAMPAAGDTRGPLCPNTQVMGRRLKSLLLILR